MGKWAKYSKKYNQKWELDDKFRGWLSQSKNNPDMAFCNICTVEIRSHKSDISKHSATNKHKSNSIKITTAELLEAEIQFNEPEDEDCTFVTENDNVEEVKDLWIDSAKEKKLKIIHEKLADAGLNFTITKIENKCREFENTLKKVKYHYNKSERDTKKSSEPQEMINGKLSALPKVTTRSYNILRKSDLKTASCVTPPASSVSDFVDINRPFSSFSNPACEDSSSNLEASGQAAGSSKSQRNSQDEILNELRKLRYERKFFQEEVFRTIKECHREKMEVLRKKNELLEKFLQS